MKRYKWASVRTTKKKGTLTAIRRPSQIIHILFVHFIDVKTKVPLELRHPVKAFKTSAYISYSSGY